MGLDRILNDFSRLQEKYAKASGNIVLCLVWNESHDNLPAECFKGYEYLEFEGIKVKAPVNYDVVLKNIYGDYMQMPPEDKRVPNHEYLLYRKE